jgi:hypothetical protein
MAFRQPVPEAGAANNKSCSGRYSWYVFAPIYDRGIKHDYSHGLLDDDGEVDSRRESRLTWFSCRMR